MHLTLQELRALIREEVSQKFAAGDKEKPLGQYVFPNNRSGVPSELDTKSH